MVTIRFSNISILPDTWKCVFNRFLLCRHDERIERWPEKNNPSKIAKYYFYIMYVHCIPPVHNIMSIYGSMLNIIYSRRLFPYVSRRVFPGNIIYTSEFRKKKRWTSEYWNSCIKKKKTHRRNVAKVIPGGVVCKRTFDLKRKTFHVGSICLACSKLTIKKETISTSLV